MHRWRVPDAMVVISYLFLSGPFANFAAMHEFYGPVHLFPGDDETVRSFIGTHGWGFPYVLEQYLTDQSDSASEVNNRTRSLEPYQDTYLNFLNRNSLAPVLPNCETEEDRLMESFLSLINSDVSPVESATDGSDSVPKSDIEKTKCCINNSIYFQFLFSCLFNSFLVFVNSFDA